MDFSKEQGANLSSKQPTHFLEDTIMAGIGSTDLWLLLHSSEDSRAPSGRGCPHGPLLSPRSLSWHLQTSDKDGQTSCV